jgi:HEAT repeat protein
VIWDFKETAPLLPDYNFGALKLLTLTGGRSAIFTDVMIEALRSLDRRLRYGAAILSKFWAGPGDALSLALIATLEDSDSEIRKEAAYSLGCVGGRAELVLPSLIAKLDEPIPRVRRSVLHAIHEYAKHVEDIPEWLSGTGYNSAQSGSNQQYEKKPRYRCPSLLAEKVAISALSILGDMDASVRASAMAVLQAIRGVPDNRSSLALKRLEELDPSLRKKLPQIVEVLDADVDLVLSAVISALKDEDKMVRRAAAILLGEIDDAPEQVAISFLPVLKDSDEIVRKNAIEAIRRSQIPAESLAPLVVEAMSCQTGELRKACVEILKRTQPFSISALRDAAKREEIGLRTLAIQTLAEINPETVSTDPENGRAEGIERMGDQAAGLIKSLTYFYTLGKISQEEDEQWRFSIRAMAPRLDISVPTLQDIIKDVTTLFRKYFAKFGHPPERGPFQAAAVGDTFASEEVMIIEREERRRPRFCIPVGRWAWELTRDYLQLVGSVASTDARK